MNFLGIDFGLSKIGLALADEESKLVVPLKVIMVKCLAQWQIVDKLKKICQAETVGKIVLGLPEGKVAFEVKVFGKNLAKATNLPLVYQDESLTSKDALAKMIASGIKKKARREKEDAFAAALILEKYLENSHV